MAQVTRLLLSVLLLAPGLAWADPLEDAQRRQLEDLRSQAAGEVHLTVLDLVDELVLGWNQAPPFAEKTPVVLASVTVPVGTGTGMEALVENHLAQVLSANPQSSLQLVHCPSCTAVVVHSGPEATVVSRGIDNPDALAELEEVGTQGQHALFVDVEAEGAFLVLRARLTRLTPERPIVWSKTLTTSTSMPSMLRAPHHLVSAAEAREDYLDAIDGRYDIRVPVRLGVRSYAQPGDDAIGGVAPPPFPWLQSGAEMSLSRGAGWTTSLMGGFSYIPTAYSGLMAQARVHRLVTGRVRSQSRPDLYAFAGIAVISVWGPGTVPFADTVATSADVLAAADGRGPSALYGAVHMGLDLRVGHRIGISAYYETMPSYFDNPNMGSYLTVFNIPFQTVGLEVTLWF